MKIKQQSGAVTLIAGRGNIGRGGGANGEYWKIFIDHRKVGVVFINLISEDPIGTHASIQIFINKGLRNRSIGRTAYRIACKKSKYNRIYAHIKKSNIASKKAAKAAGFADVTPEGNRQLILMWYRY